MASYRLAHSSRLLFNPEVLAIFQVIYHQIFQEFPLTMDDTDNQPLILFFHFTEPRKLAPTIYPLFPTVTAILYLPFIMVS